MIRKARHSRCASVAFDGLALVPELPAHPCPCPCPCPQCRSFKELGERQTHGNAAAPDPNFNHCRDPGQDRSATAGIPSGSTPPPGVLHGRFYKRIPIVLPRVPLIVSAAAQAKILNRALATYRPRHHVVEL